MIHASAGSEKWPCGLYEERGRKLYVTGGVGVSIIPVRFLQPPEIALVTLRED
jgi:predicted MPP superfamily phosphohydrolase